MAKSLPRGLIYFGAILISVIGWMATVNGYSYAQNSKSAKGLHFNVSSEDWPIEKRGGLLGPIPVEEYVVIKFKAINEEFQTIKDELAEKFDQLKFDLEGVEENLSKEIQKIQSRGELREESGDRLEDVLSDLALFERELGRLDRKITNKVQVMQTQFEKIHQQIRSVEEGVKGLQAQIYKLDEKVDYLREKPPGSY